MERSALEKLARLLRYYILTMTTAAQSGHATSSLSAVELATTLFFKYFRFDLDHPDNPANDRLIFSKGHASPLLYALYAVAGKISEEKLLGYRSFDSVLEGHPTPRFAYTEAATGSLGQGLSIGVGEALSMRLRVAAQNFVGSPQLPMVYVILGDGELAEGSVWEAAACASFHKLYNLVAIIDVNRLGQSQETMYQDHAEIYQRRFDAFGWSTIVIDGHNWDEIDLVYQKALDHKKGPVVIIAKTIKGKGVPFWEDKNGWHSKQLTKEQLIQAIVGLGEVDTTIIGLVKKPQELSSRDRSDGAAISKVFSEIASSPAKPDPRNDKVHYDPNNLIATKKAFGNAIERLGSRYPDLIVLDGDVKNSLHTDQFEQQFPQRFLQMYIAEQNMVGVATGFARRGYLPFVTTFASFMSRAHDQIRLAALSDVTILFNGSYAGVSIGKDGPSQMGLEDIALFRSVQGSTVLYPADPYATERLVQRMMEQKGIVYIRTARLETPVIYTEKDEFTIGGSNVHYSSREESSTSREVNQDSSRLCSNNKDVVTIIAAGVTVHEALKAQKELEHDGIPVRVIDCYSVKPIDAATVQKAALDSKAIVVVEDHYPEGGLGEAVKSALLDSGNPRNFSFIHLAVRKQPRSGSPEELIDFEDISARKIIEVIKHLQGNK